MKEQKTFVKTLFDHGHTNRNKLVIYDDEPVIEAVMKQAQDRHKGNLKEHEEFLKYTHKKQQEIIEVASRHSDLRKNGLNQQKEEMKVVLEQQMNFKVKLQIIKICCYRTT